MTSEAILEQMQPIFRDVFDDPALTVSPSTTSADIEDWDSLAQISLVVAMEHAFGLKFNLDEVNALPDIGGMVDLIALRLAEKIDA